MSKKLTKHESEILFSNFNEDESFEREIVEKYSKNTRGSVRLATGRYYTKEEMKKRAEKAFSVKF